MAGKKGSKGGARVGERPFLHVHLRAFVHATEDPDKVGAALARAAGYDPDDPEDTKAFEAGTDIIHTEGYFHNPILILETELRRKRDIDRFWAHVQAENGLAPRLLNELDDRFDDDLVLWLRLDKQAAARGSLRLHAGEDVIQVRAKLATYPKDRAVGVAFLRDFLGGALI